MIVVTGAWCWVVVLGGFAAVDERHLADYEFVCETVARQGAAAQSRDLDWKRASERLRPDFAACTDDLEHVVNVMRLLALLQDSHTGVTRVTVQGGRPSKFDGLYGGGAWLGWDEGRWLLRGLMDGHPQAEQWPIGSVITAVDGVPTPLVLARERRRIAETQGISSDHSLFASLSNRGLPFGEAQSVEVAWFDAERGEGSCAVRRWGPGGKAFDLRAGTLPEGMVPAPGAVSGWLPGTEPRTTAYLRITGSMDATTTQAFHRAFDGLEGMEALLLDCRGMGGGSDSAAWEMAGRLFPGGVANGSSGRIEASGPWQFDGPVVMLQDALEVSAAETFIWALSETGRVVSVGRPTGGWAIIPRGFDCPSGLCSFRLGVRDRGTPIEGRKTEGIGWRPDVLLPMAPGFAEPGRALEVAGWVLSALAGGGEARAVREAFSELFAGSPKRFESAARRWKEWPHEAGDLVEAVRDSARREIALERGLLAAPVPDAAGAVRRSEWLLARAAQLGLGDEAAAWKKELKAGAKEAAAQSALLELAGPDGRVDADELQRWTRRHGRTAWGRWVAAHRARMEREEG